MREPLLSWSEALLWVRASRSGEIIETSATFERAAGESWVGRPLESLVSPEHGGELTRLLAAAAASPQETRLPLLTNADAVPSQKRVLAVAESDGFLLVAEPPVEDLRRLLSSTMEMNASLLELRSQLQHANERLRLLESVGAVGLTHRNVSTVLDELLRLMCHMLEGDDAAILLLDEEREVLRLESSLGRSDPVGFEVPLGEGVSGSVASSGAPRIVDDLSRSEVHSKTLAARGGSMVAVPLRAGGRLIGVTNVSSARVGRFDQADARLLQLVADRASLAIDNVRAYEREHRSSLELQRSLLPEFLPSIEGIRLAARYLPAGDVNEVGGDWFDALALPEGRVGLAIGDVAGRGLDAAAAMGRLSHTLHAYALEHPSPAAVLERVNRFAYEEELIATATYVVLDPSTGQGSYASCGHLPAVVRSNGEARLLARAAAPPLGTELRAVPEIPLDLSPPALLVLYTDGLVEVRGEEIDAGLERLLGATAAGPDEPGRMSADLLRTLVGERAGEDDVAIVVAQIG